ncbi:MAG: S-adenosylmethionine:tRNA ribosyltransferase-isomerase, partial [Ktedonobacteraceae bacterium]
MTTLDSLPFRLLSSAVPNNAMTLNFDLPEELEAGEPPEARGLARDQVRLMVSYRSDNCVVHTQFRQIVDFLAPGDALIINTSGTLNAALH